MGNKRRRRQLCQAEDNKNGFKLLSLTMPMNFGLISLPTGHKMLPQGQFSYKLLVLLNIEPEAISFELVIEALKEDPNLINHVPPVYRYHPDVVAVADEF